MRSMRSVVRPVIVFSHALSCVVLSSVVLAAATAQASVQKIQQPSSRTDRADTRSLAVSITGVTPQFAKSTTPTVTVSGTLTNHTGSTIRDIQVRLQWYPLTFLTRSGMDSFASGGPVSLPGGQYLGVLEPAERPVGVQRAGRVDRDRPGPDLGGHRLAAADIGGPYRAGQAVLRVVGEGDRLGLIVVRDHRGDRAEYLLAGDRHGLVADHEVL